MERLIKHSNGQWDLQKDDSAPKPSISNLVGQTHTIEVHPHIDHLLNVKGMIQASGKPHMQLSDVKKSGIASHIINHIPRDANGKVTPEGIDNHIASLPKHKVQVQVTPYEMASQQHRPGQQYTVSVGMHPDTVNNMKPNYKNSWEDIKSLQHDLEGHPDQIGWARVDPHKTENGNEVPNNRHWHVDEIQSDYQNHDKIGSKMKGQSDENFRENQYTDIHQALADKQHPNHELFHNAEIATKNALHEGALAKQPDESWEQTRARRAASPEHAAHEEARKKLKDHINQEVETKLADRKKNGTGSVKGMHELLSHGHDDPQHLVHSAINALARKHGIESMSMDTPKDQAKQSLLRDRNPDTDFQDMGEIDQDLHRQHAQDFFDHNYSSEKHEKIKSETPNKYLKSALEKVPHELTHKMLINATRSPDHQEGLDNEMESHFSKPGDTSTENKTKLSGAEYDMLKEHLYGVARHAPSLHDPLYDPSMRQQESTSEKKGSLPVHQIDTYDKRPKKLGYKNVDKKSILGEHPEDEQQEIQYAKLHKKLATIQEILRKMKQV